MIRPHSQRLQILELLNDLMLNHRAALKGLGDESIIGITDLVSGEKDPRSLMIIFSILHVVMVEWDIPRQAEVCDHHTLVFYPTDFARLYSTLSSAISQSPFVRLRMTHFASRHRI